MQDNNLRIAFDYKYPDSPALMVYDAFVGSIFAEGSIRVRKTIVGDETVKIYSQLTGKSIPDIHMEAGNTNWGAFDSALAERQVNNEVKFKTNNNDLSRQVREAEELSRKIQKVRNNETLNT